MDHAYRLCMELLGIPVARELHRPRNCSVAERRVSRRYATCFSPAQVSFAFHPHRQPLSRACSVTTCPQKSISAMRNDGRIVGSVPVIDRQLIDFCIVARCARRPRTDSRSLPPKLSLQVVMPIPARVSIHVLARTRKDHAVHGATRGMGSPRSVILPSTQRAPSRGGVWRALYHSYWLQMRQVLDDAVLQSSSTRCSSFSYTNKPLVSEALHGRSHATSLLGTILELHSERELVRTLLRILSSAC